MAPTVCPRGWFPPATFQLRLRSLRSILYIGEKLLKSYIQSKQFSVKLEFYFR